MSCRPILEALATIAVFTTLAAIYAVMPGTITGSIL
jgi:hypothetical protein